MRAKWKLIAITLVLLSTARIAKAQLHALVYTGDQAERKANPLSTYYGMRFAVPPMHLDQDALEFIDALHALNVTDVHLLKNPNTSQEALDAELDTMEPSLRPQDTMLVYVAARLYENSQIGAIDLRNVFIELGPNGPQDIPLAHLMARLRRLPSRNLVLVFLDTNNVPIQQLLEAILQFPPSPTGGSSSVSILTADVLSLHQGRSQLSRSLIRGLRGPADLNQDGAISSDELQTYLQQQAAASNPSAIDRMDPSFTDQSWTLAARSTQPSYSILAKLQQPSAQPVIGGARPAASPTRGIGLEKDPSTTSPTLPLPHTHALLFATDHYDHWPTLSNPITDAQALQKTLKDLYDVDATLIADPSAADVTRSLHDFLSRTYEPNAQLIIYFAGHGFFDSDLKQGYFVFRDAALPNLDPSHQTLLTFDQVLRYAERIPVNHLLLIADTCFSGALDSRVSETGMRGDATDTIYSPATLAQVIQSETARPTKRFLTSGGTEYVPDGAPGQHSPFSRALLTTLAKNAEERGYTRWRDLQTGLEIVRPEPHWGTVGTADDPNGDFILLTPRMRKDLQQSPIP